ncbi:MAG: hypothetical protein JWN01_370 [Patescibacteria group bacterium]|nr:hypothetical protein [Patescibacteria group bacterium]
MLNTQFIGLNLHFAVNIFAALVCFGVFWLIFDAWTIRRSRKEMVKWGGFLLLSLGFLLRATAMNSQAGDFSQYTYYLSGALRLLGYIGIAISQIFDPLMEKPKYENESILDNIDTSVPSTVPPLPSAKPGRRHHAFAIGPVVGFCLPLLAGMVAALYWRRATTGLERHLRPVALGFACLTVFELLSDVSSIKNVQNPNLYRLVETFGPIWWAALVVLVAASIILGNWVWHYLVKRIQTQLFILVIAQTLVIFLVSTVGFTFLLLRNIQEQSLTDLTTASHVLDYAISSRQAETAAQAEAVAGKSAVATAIAARDHRGLATALADYMAAHGLTTLTITDGSGQVLLRGEDPDRWGDSRSSDSLVRRGLIGQSSSSVVVRDGVVAPSVTLVAASPVRDAAGVIVGTVTTGRAISTAFVDGIRASTGLDSAVYGGNIRAATTLVSQNGADRAVGIKETSTAITDQVLKQGKSYSGPVSLQNRAYLAAFAPLRDVNKVAVGMLLVARPQDALYAAANHSVQLTFLFVVVLVLLSVYPIYLISRYLSRQLK